MIRLHLFHLAARALRITPTYTLKFLPTQRKRTDMRGRAIATTNDVHEAALLLHAIQHNPSARKEKTDGFYYLEIEAREGLIQHTPVAGEGRGGLHAGLPDAAQAGPEAAPATQAADDVAPGDPGTGADGEHIAGPEAAAGPVQSVGEVMPASQFGLVNRPRNPSLADIGTR